ncbi:hypothetical protein [Persephonella sp.]
MRIVGSLATKFAPPFSLVLHYFIGAVFFNFVAISVLFLFGGNFEPPFYALHYAGAVHLFLLGFVMMTIFGALYQLIPVALEVPVFSFKAGYIQFYVYTAGIVLMTIAMYSGDLLFLLPYGGLLVYISMLIFAVNFFLSIRVLEKFDITSRFMISAVVSLVAGISAGLFLAFNFVYGFYSGSITKIITVHLLFSLFGAVFMVIMGVSMVLLPMFSLAHKFNDIYIKVSFYLINLSVFGGGILILIFDTAPAYIFAFGTFLISLALYVVQVFEIYRNRPRKTPDIGMDTMFWSHLLLIPVVFSTTAVLLWEKAVFTAGAVLMYGFLTLLIYGALYKIVPFLTWFHRFSSLVGKKKVPMLADMLPKKIPENQVMVYSAGLLMFIFGLLLQSKYVVLLGNVVMILGSLLFSYVVYYILSFKMEE